MPDIDIDFCIERRGEVIDYIKKQYGEESVTQIITFGKMKANKLLEMLDELWDIVFLK